MKKYKITISFIYILFVCTTAFTQERIERLDSINGIYIPKNIKDCISQIDKMWSDSIKNEIISLSQTEFNTSAFYGFGIWIRNNWGLWKDSRLKTYFIKQGVYHPDNMSGIILTSYYRHLTNQKVHFKRLTRPYKKKYKYQSLNSYFRAKTIKGDCYFSVYSALQLSDSITEIEFHNFEEFPSKLKKFKNLKSLSIEKCGNINLTKEFKKISKLQRLDSLTLWNNSFYHYPVNIEEFKQLRSLYISGDSISFIPKSLLGFGKLEVLVINQCPNIELESLFQLVVNIKTLKELDLSENNISEIPTGIKNLTELKELWLCSNQLTEIPEEIKSLPDLEHLSLSDNKLNSLNVKNGDFPKLTSIDLSFNNFQTFPIELYHVKYLEKIKMRENNVQKIPSNIINLKELKYLNLEQNYLNDIEKEKLRKCLSNTVLNL